MATEFPEPLTKSNTLLETQSRTQSLSIATSDEARQMEPTGYPADWAIDKALFRSDVKRFMRGARPLLKDPECRAFVRSHTPPTPPSASIGVAQYIEG
ncbi:hypothetical protein FQN50_007007 [Emmonsiellopsis sp. PD_5]|nr:hypothetical protein FQN50_007007 [Emmonsiellopsis sp. PD_5]